MNSKILSRWLVVFSGRPALVAKAFTLVAPLTVVLSSAVAAVPAADITLQPVITDNAPVFSSLSGYDITSANGGQLPLFAPYDSGTSAWWDNLIQEQLQARMPVITFATRGTYSDDPAVLTGQGNMNPRRLYQAIDAITRAHANDLFKIMCFVDSPAIRYVMNSLVGHTPLSDPADLSVVSTWHDAWWVRTIKPWFDTVPKQYWYRVNGHPVIQFWSVKKGAWFTNTEGNLGGMLQQITSDFQAAYGETPVFFLIDSWVNRDDPASLNLPSVIGVSPWFGPATDPAQFATFDGLVTGTVVAGNAATSILRNGGTGAGAYGDTLKTGLQKAIDAKANFALIEGWTDWSEAMGLYRSTDAAWTYPNLYINILGSYNDRRTTTQRLEAEGADEYFDTTPGNAGGVFRGGDLDIKKRVVEGHGWQVGWTAAGEWLQWDNGFFSSGNYTFTVRSGSPGAHTVRLFVDGTALPDVTLPATGGYDTLDTFSIGTKRLGHGTHTFKLLFVDGGVDVDWLFVKKTDPIASFQSAFNNSYVSADLGGNSGLSVNRTLATAWEHFTLIDLTGGLVSGNNVNLQAHNGLYLGATLGGGAAFYDNRTVSAAWETFKLIKVGGTGPIVSGDQVALQTSDGIHYVTALANGASDCSGTSIGAAQTFTLRLSPVGTAPAAPTTLTATAVSGSQVNLAWHDNATNEGAFFIERSYDGATFTRVATVNANVTAYGDTGLSGYTPVIYRVRASNETANSDYTNLATATTQPGVSAPPAEVTAFNGASLTTPAVKLSWSAANGATSYQIKRSTTNGSGYAPIGTSATASFTDATAALNTTYYYVVNAVNSYGTSGNSAQVSARPVKLQIQTLGTGTGGSTTESGGVFSLHGSGTGDIWNTADSFQFAYQTMTGDGAIVARVGGTTGTVDWAKSGLMMRGDLTVGSSNVFMCLAHNHGAYFQYRTVAGATSGAASIAAGIGAPQWLMLTRSGSTFTGYYSADGVNWTPVSQLTLTLPNTLYVGLAQSNNFAATFDHVWVPAK